MLSHVTISQYRGFKEFAVTGLAQVNLFVGKNNSGKSALLEAVHFLASGGDPAVLVGAATERGETFPGEFEELSFVDVSHFFWFIRYFRGKRHGFSGRSRHRRGSRRPCV